MINYSLKETSKLKDNSFHIDKDCRNRKFKMHTHNFTELSIIYSGYAKHSVEDNEYFIKAGDIFVIPPNVKHKTEDSKNLFIYSLQYLRNKWLKNFEKKLKKLAGYQGLFILEPYFRKKHNFKNKLHLEPKKMVYVKEIVNSILDEYSEQKEGCKLMIHSHFITLLIYLAREYNKNKNYYSQNLTRLADVLSFIETNYNKSITVEELAKQSGFSRRHFIRIFKEHYDLPPGQYIIQCRLRHACNLLKKTNKQITDIALNCGYTDSNHFSQQFKKHYDISPSKFRNQYNNNLLS